MYKRQILVIEGIHCLNDRLSYTLPADSKFKIYISALTQLNIDEHNRIPTTDGRLLRLSLIHILGHSVRERLNNMIHDIILNSMDKPAITMSEGMEEAMQGLRKWMFDNVYKNDIPKAEEDVYKRQ